MKVSVYLITYNRKKLLERAILSVINQTYKNIELIVVDDNSQDGTHEYLEAKYYEYNKLINFQYYVNRENKGACFSRNRAINIASGKFITGLDDDDYFKKDRIQNFINFWEIKSYNSICLFSNYHVISKNSSLITKLKPIVSQRDLLYINQIGNQVFLERKNLLLINGFSENMPAWQDLECWYRLLVLGKAENTFDATYVVDIGHSNERISLSHSSKIKEAYEKICTNNRLDFFEKNILKSQILRYQINFSTYFSCLVISLISFDIKLFKQLHKNLCKGTFLRKWYNYIKKNYS